MSLDSVLEEQENEVLELKEQQRILGPEKSRKDVLIEFYKKRQNKPKTNDGDYDEEDNENNKGDKKDFLNDVKDLVIDLIENKKRNQEIRQNIEHQVEKMNEVLDTQKKQICIAAIEYAKSQFDAANNITQRHQLAESEIQKSIEAIDSQCEYDRRTSNDDKFSEISDLLNNI